MIDASEAEMAVIGSCLCEPESLRTALEMLSPENFYGELSREVFEKMGAHMASGKPVDVVTMMSAFPSGSDHAAWLVNVAGAVPSALHVVHYAEIVKKAWSERRFVRACHQAAEDPQNEAYRESVRQAMADDVAQSRRFTTMVETAGAYLTEMDGRAQGMGTVYKTPYPTWNRFLTGGGFRPGQLAVVGARTSRGKSSMLLALAAGFAERGAKVMFLSAEMTTVEMMDRLTAMRSQIPLWRLSSPKWVESKERIVSVVSQLSRLPLSFSVGGKLTLERVAADVDAKMPDIVVVDYIQRFTVPAGKENGRAAFFSDVANGLKSLALAKNVFVLTASQLGRAVEFRDDKMPVLADLKESGGLEEASDIVAFIHVPNDPDERNRRRGEIVMAKQRNGPVAKFPVVFDGDTTRFTEEEPDVEPPPM